MTDTQADLTQRARALGLTVAADWIANSADRNDYRGLAEFVRKHAIATLQSEREAAAGEARSAAIEECVGAVNAEEELEGEPPQAVIKLMLDDPPAFLRATVRATKRGIRNRIRALASPPAPQEERRARCAGGLSVRAMGTRCPKCGAGDDDFCGYLNAPQEDKR